MVCVVSYETDGVVHTPQIKCAAVVTDQIEHKRNDERPYNTCVCPLHCLSPVLQLLLRTESIVYTCAILKSAALSTYQTITNH